MPKINTLIKKKISLKKSNKKIVTIVIPTFNRKDFLKKTIDSCLKQTYPCEIIVCDHGSSDGTDKFMERYKEKVTYIRREKDFGPHFCWLEGVLNATGEFIHLQYDDDWIEDTFIEKTVKLMEKNVGCVFTGSKIFDEQKKDFVGFSTHEKLFSETGIYKKNKIERRLLLSGGVISPGCCLFRKNELIEGIYQGNLLKKRTTPYHGVGPDVFVMLLGFLRYTKIGVVKEELAIFRAHESSITVEALKNEENLKKLRLGYDEVIDFYLFLKLYWVFQIFSKLMPYSIIRKNSLIIKKLLDKLNLFNFFRKFF